MDERIDKFISPIQASTIDYSDLRNRFQLIKNAKRHMFSKLNHCIGNDFEK